MKTVTINGLEVEGSSVSLETQVLAPSLNAIIATWYLGVYDNLDPGRGGIVIDGGASVGDFTLKASRWVGNGGIVVAVEPDPENLALLKRNLLINRVSNVVVVAKALGDREDTIDFNGRTIETISIDGLLDELGISHVDSIKLDIEGAEENAIRGSKRTIKDALHFSVETHSPELFENVCKTLAFNGYHVYQPSFSFLLTKMWHKILVDPFPFLLTEATRIVSWDRTKGPFTWSILRWLYQRRRPDWFARHRRLAILAADRPENKPFRSVTC